MKRHFHHSLLLGSDNLIIDQNCFIFSQLTPDNGSGFTTTPEPGLVTPDTGTNHLLDDPENYFTIDHNNRLVGCEALGVESTCPLGSLPAPPSLCA